jgi:hypothetical protein
MPKKIIPHKQIQISAAVFFMAGSLFVYFYLTNLSRETIIYFPIDPTISFETASTKLNAQEQPNNSFTLDWKVDSTLEKEGYLRQDISLLFMNGRLIGVLRDWKQNSMVIQQEKSLSAKQSGVFDAVSFHYAELHPGPDVFKSAQYMTGDQLYVISSRLSAFQSFRNPMDSDQKDWKQTLDNLSLAIRKEALLAANKFFQVNSQDYDIFRLTELYATRDKILSGFTNSKREEIIGKLWEGLYKNYVLGIKKEAQSVSPLNSTEPLLLVAKDKRELIIISLTADGDPILLRQKLPSSS